MRLVCLTILISFGVLFSLQANDGVFRVAVVDMVKAFESHPKTAAAEARVASAQKSARDTFIKESGQLKGVLDRYQKVVSGGNDQKEADKLAAKAEEHERQLAVLTTKQEMDLEAQILRDRKEILAEVQAAVKAINRERKFHLILDTSATSASGIPSVIDTQGVEDLTDAVIAILKRK